MSVVRRMNRLFQADVHGILDQLEDPLSAMRQAVREMEESVIDDERQLARIGRREQQLGAVLGESRRLREEQEGQLALALREGKEELLRTIMRRRLEEESRQRELEFALAQLGRQRQETDTRLQERKTRLAATVKKLELYADPSEPGDPLAGPPRRVRPVTEEDVELAVLKLKSEGASR